MYCIVFIYYQIIQELQGHDPFEISLKSMYLIPQQQILQRALFML